ncbi:MAG: hypothetical protein K2G77_05230, partial [Muribaculaceae bacterium]|nr:hypothetical protein [Muribaculaceae bacterium]
ITPEAENKENKTEGMRTIHVPADRYVFTISKRAVHAAAMLITILTIGLSLMIPINHDNEQKASVISIEGFFHHKVKPNVYMKSGLTSVENEEIDSISSTEPISTL